MDKISKKQLYLPIVLALVLIIGIYLGTRISFYSAPGNNGIIVQLPGKYSGSYQNNKLNEILSYIDHEYVDSVAKEELIEKAIQSLLQELDPHSYYISAEELQALNEPLEGNFEGVGIQFNIQKDTVLVISPIAGGPSEQVGILAGDRIIKVNGEKIAGNGVTNKKVMDLLRGEKGTEVNVSVQRAGTKDLMDFAIVRDKIPIHSIDVSFMAGEKEGYIKISRFSKTTHEEFQTAAKKLKSEGMQKLILDLRGNGGGYMDAAVNIADEFLEKGKIIVYTQGKARPKKMYLGTRKGGYKDVPLVILIDEGAASASEIIAGAIQDNDRGTIIGRRSFGKGLVQEQSSWPDGSALRLTIARYYTPTGRCIQKPYDEGTKKYFEDFSERLENSNQPEDSMPLPDSLKFVTPGGKVVYGGGGITPDILIPADTSGGSIYLSNLYYRGIIRQFAFEYVDKKRKRLMQYKDVSEFDRNFVVDDPFLEDLFDFAEENNVQRNEKDIQRSKELIILRLKADIARNVWGEQGFYPLIMKEDKAVQKALKVLSNDQETDKTLVNQALIP